MSPAEFVLIVARLELPDPEPADLLQTLVEQAKHVAFVNELTT